VVQKSEGVSSQRGVGEVYLSISLAYHLKSGGEVRLTYMPRSLW
jgi:hypothetical protein